MARYFFHTQTDNRYSDVEGLELDGLQAARTEAIRTAGELMRDGGDKFWSTRPWSITVTDGAGFVLYEIVANGYGSVANG